MNRRMTMVFGAIVAVVIFAVMGLAISNTVPWVGPEAVVENSDHAATTFRAAAKVAENRTDVNVTSLTATGQDLSTFASAYAGGLGHGGPISPSMETASSDFRTKLASFNQALGTLSAISPKAKQVVAVDVQVGNITSHREYSIVLGPLNNLTRTSHDLAAASSLLADAMEKEPANANDLTAVTDVLFGNQVIAFEVLGILLTAAMIGALVIARPLDAPSDESRYSHPTPQQVAETERVSDVKHAVMTGPSTVPSAAPEVPE